MKPIDYKKLFQKCMIAITGFLVVMLVGFALVQLVLQPIIWVTNMLGRISEMMDFDSGDEEEITDYRIDLDELTKDYHIGYKYSEMLACSMHKDYTHDIKACIQHLQDDGTFDTSIDTDPAGSFQIYSQEVNEYQGTIPDSAYEDIWIPTLYEKDHYREEEVIDEETGEVKKDAEGNAITQWVFDYTEEEPYKDACDAMEPETKCRLTREGFWTYPYIPPAAGDVSQRYGYDLTNEETSVSLLFNTEVSYGSGYVLALSTGDVIETGSEDGGYIVQKIENQGTEFYARYTGVSNILCETDKEYEQNEILGMAGTVSVKTYFLNHQQQQYFNPMLLFSVSEPWKYEDTYTTESWTPIIGGIMEIDGVIIDFGSKYYTFAAKGIDGNPCVCDKNNHIAWPYSACLARSVTGSWNKMICSSYAAGRYWEVNNPNGTFPLPLNWDQKLSVDHVSPGNGTYSTDPSSPIAGSIASIRFGGVLHDVFIEGVGEDGSVVISECNATASNQYGFRVGKYSSFQAFLNSYGATLNGMYGP